MDYYPSLWFNGQCPFTTTSTTAEMAVKGDITNIPTLIMRTTIYYYTVVL